MNIQPLERFEFRRMVSEGEGKIITTSLKVAEFFGKEHKNVLRAIRGLHCSDDFKGLNFEQCFKINELANGKREPYFEMTKDGFVFLVMGFSGKKAARIKETYIEAFNWMTDQLHREVFSITAELNAASLAYNQAEVSASACGRGLRHWQDTKPDFERRISELKELAQIPIKFH